MKTLLISLLCLIPSIALADYSGAQFGASNSGQASISETTITIPSGTGSKCFSADDPTLVVNCNLHKTTVGGSAGLVVTYGAAVGTMTSAGLVSASSFTSTNDASFATSAGSVGIGTNSPRTKLEVNGHIFSTGYASPTSGTGISLGFTGGIGYITSINGANSVYQGVQLYGSTYTFTTQNSANALVILNSGNVGLNTASPATVLDVGGNAQFGSGANKSTFTATGSLTLATNATTNIANITNSGSIGSGYAETLTSFNVCSATKAITTNGGPVFISIWADAKNSVINDGCILYLLLDGAFLNGETASTGIMSMQSAVATDTAELGYANFIFGTPSAAAHNVCFGIAALTGGTCTYGSRNNVQFSVTEIR